jgi:replicative DNA helicase
MRIEKLDLWIVYSIFQNPLHMYRPLIDILSASAVKTFEILGHKTGFKALDYSLNGISNSDLLLVVAKAGNFGSHLLQNIGVGLSRQNHVLFINSAKNEGTYSKELTSILSATNELEGNDEETVNESNRLAQNLFVDSKSHFIVEIDRAIGAFKRENSSDSIVLIDNLNSVFLSTEVRTVTREQEEFEIVGNLKMLTLKHNVPILVFLRTKSKDPSDESKIPTPADYDYLEGVSSKFDKVFSIHRPEFYKIEVDEQGDSTENKIFIHILRNSNGNRDRVKLTISENNRLLLVENES